MAQGAPWGQRSFIIMQVRSKSTQVVPHVRSKSDLRCKFGAMPRKAVVLKSDKKAGKTPKVFVRAKASNRARLQYVGSQKAPCKDPKNTPKQGYEWSYSHGWGKVCFDDPKNKASWPDLHGQWYCRNCKCFHGWHF